MNESPNLSRLAVERSVTSAEIAGRFQASHRRSWRNLLRPERVERGVLVADFCLIIITCTFWNLVYNWVISGQTANITSAISIGVMFAINYIAIVAARHNYRIQHLTLLTRQVREVTIIWCGVTGMLLTVGFTMKISSEFSRGSAILFFFVGLTELLISRVLVANFIFRSLATQSFVSKSVIVIAEHDRAISSQPLTELRRFGYKPAKICVISKQEITARGVSESLSTKLAEVIDFSRNEHIEEIYLLISWYHHRVIDVILNALAVIPVSVHLVPDESAARFLNNPISNVGDTWTAELRRTPLIRTERAAKRFFDLCLASLALIGLAPLMLVTAMLIRLDSSGPVFFRQKRNGFNGYPFDILKFRTMHVLENGAAIRQATRNDPRVTRLGRWLRRSSIDELPQLFNVLRGDMSLVGPRPHATSHNSEYEKLIANYAFRHHVKPGLTGWAQVNGHRGETPKIEQMERRVEHDLWYINNWSPLLDLKIVLRTIVVALRQTTAY
jgi:Undecaprenyl-phosphate glucose phosphotransferase